MGRPSVKRIAAISTIAIAVAWLVGLVVTLREAGDTLSAFTGDFGVGQAGDGIDALPRGTGAIDSPVTEAAERDDLPSFTPPEDQSDSSRRASIWRCDFGPSSSCQRFRGEPVDAAWAAATEGKIRATLLATRPLLNETFEVICRTTICAINFSFRELPDVHYLHGQIVKLQPELGWGQTVAGWVTDDGENVSYFQIRSWLHDRGHEVRVALIEAGLIQDGSGFIVESRDSPEIWWWTIHMYRCPTHLLDACGTSSTAQTVP